MVSANSGDVGGTTVYLTDDRTATGAKVFIDVDAIVLTAASGSAVTPCYAFTDVGNPLSFAVYLFNSTTGARASGTVSYTVRGF